MTKTDTGKKIAETFFIAFFSALFGYIGTKIYTNGIVMPSFLAGIGGVIGVLFFVFPKNTGVAQGKPLGPWTQMMRKEYLRFRKKAIIGFLKVALSISASCFAGFYSLQYIIPRFNDDNNVNNSAYTLLNLLFLASLFGIFYAVTLGRRDMKWNIREYKRYKNVYQQSKKGFAK